MSRSFRKDRHPGNMSRAEQFERIIVKTGPGGAITRLRDVARTEEV